MYSSIVVVCSQKMLRDKAVLKCVKDWNTRWLCNVASVKLCTNRVTYN